MKERSAEKSGILSSVIVSLLAGFIYYQFGNDIQVTLERSYKAALSYSDSEIFGPFYSQSLYSQIRNSDKKNQIKVRSGFFIKKNGIADVEDVKKYSSLTNKNQAKFQRSVPDMNIDFTTELNNLIKKNQQTEMPEIKRNKNPEMNISETEVQFLKVIPLNKNADLYTEENSDESEFENENCNVTNEVMSTDKYRFNYKFQVNVHMSDDTKKSGLKCKTDQNNTNRLEPINPEIHFRIYINDGEEDSDAPEINKEYDMNDEDQM